MKTKIEEGAEKEKPQDMIDTNVESDAESSSLNINIKQEVDMHKLIKKEASTSQHLPQVPQELSVYRKFRDNDVAHQHSYILQTLD